MNRYKKELKRQHDDARRGLTPEQVAELDRQDAEKALLAGRVQRLHGELFPEEYDEMMDSGWDQKLRQEGKNPMNAEYTQMVNERRASMGVTPLGPAGRPMDNSSYDYCERYLLEHPEWTPKPRR